MIDVGGARVASVGRNPSSEWHGFAGYDSDKREIDASGQVEHASIRQGRRARGRNDLIIRRRPHVLATKSFRLCYGVLDCLASPARAALRADSDLTHQALAPGGIPERLDVHSDAGPCSGTQGDGVCLGGHHRVVVHAALIASCRLARITHDRSRGTHR